jgi:hypothetical protein
VALRAIQRWRGPISPFYRPHIIPIQPRCLMSFTLSVVAVGLLLYFA